MYAETHGNAFSSDKFARRLWGNIYLHSNRSFSTKPEPGAPVGTSERTFVQFILDPVYKIYSHVLGCEPLQLADVCAELGVSISKDELHMDPRPLLKLVLGRFLGAGNGPIDHSYEMNERLFDIQRDYKRDAG